MSNPNETKSLKNFEEDAVNGETILGGGVVTAVPDFDPLNPNNTDLDIAKKDQKPQFNDDGTMKINDDGTQG